MTELLIIWYFSAKILKFREEQACYETSKVWKDTRHFVVTKELDNLLHSGVVKK